MIFPEPLPNSITGLKCPLGWKYEKSIPYLACYNTSNIDNAKENKDYVPMWRGSKKASYCCIKNAMSAQQDCESLGFKKDVKHWKRCPKGEIVKGIFSYDPCYIVSNKQCCQRVGKGKNSCKPNEWTNKGVQLNYNMKFQKTPAGIVTTKALYNEQIQKEITKGVIRDGNEAMDFNNYGCKKQGNKSEQPFKK
jgi:hypothetical protein